MFLFFSLEGNCPFNLTNMLLMRITEVDRNCVEASVQNSSRVADSSSWQHVRSASSAFKKCTATLRALYFLQVLRVDEEQATPSGMTSTLGMPPRAFLSMGSDV